jgi:chorismate dehydratase
MSGIVRLGAVGYLNAAPLVWGLDRRRERFDVRFDMPSRCADLLHAGDVDLGLIPSIEHLRAEPYCIVPGVAIASSGPVASVALFSTRPVSAVRSIALDHSSRTSAALLRILCARRFGIRPRFETLAPDLPQMVREADAALVIGDAALYADHQRLGLEKSDLGEAWTGLTGLPFVWAFWAGRPGAVGEADVRVLQAVRDRGVAEADAVAAAFFPGDARKAERGARYLRENIDFRFGERHAAGLRRFYEEAAALGLVPASRELRFFGRSGSG